MSNDLIRRRDAMMEARPEYLNPIQKGHEEYNKAWNDAIEAYWNGLKELPSERLDWIPVSERLPNEDGRYLLTVNDRVRIGYWADNLLKVDNWDFYNKDRCGFYDYDNEWGHYEIHDVVAWMPLPEPHKEVEND